MSGRLPLTPAEKRAAAASIAARQARVRLSLEATARKGAAGAAAHLAAQRMAAAAAPRPPAPPAAPRPAPIQAVVQCRRCWGICSPGSCLAVLRSDGLWLDSPNDREAATGQCDRCGRDEHTRSSCNVKYSNKGALDPATSAAQMQRRPNVLHEGERGHGWV